ncbi:zinc finger protein 81 [Diachasma alloeum]|uniref:zinc finger protein 81 n=1 Tax=Diachasma alloeum TaxID=454923 RepID=UPI0007382EE8|nr:zinc finger protein 81 [Diachasma alloeum]XP_015113674.1 zinc finger protein 81 [Diachasma alloeum]
MTTLHSNRRLINDICRLCLKQGNALPSIFEEINQETHMAVLVEKITSIARVEITPTDGLPLSICHMCRRQVNQFYEFRLLVEMSDKALRTCLKSGQLQDQSGEMEMAMFKNMEDNEYKDILDRGSDAFNVKDMMNYALLVPTNQGFQVWKINDIEQNQELDKLIKTESPMKRNIDELNRVQKSLHSKAHSFVDTMQLQQPCDFLRAYVKEEVDVNDQSFLNNMTSCQLCFSEFGSLEDLKNHIAEHCLSYENESHIVDQGNTLHNKQTVSSTLLIEPNDKIFTESVVLPSQEINKSQKCKLFKCRYCNKSFSKIILKKHGEKCQLKEVQFICTECGEKFTKRSELRHHKGTHLTLPLMCPTCDKVFRNVQSFKMHMKRHTLGSRYNCETCGQSYYTNSELARHVQKHEDKRKYPCHLCDTSFLSKPELNRHMKYHNGVKKFECNLCYKSYYESGHLKVHQRVHTGERPFVCPLCNKGFVTRSKLARHSKIHCKQESVS